MFDANSAAPREKLLSLMDFVEFINLFRSVRRTIWYKGSDHVELDGDHSFQVAMVAWFVNCRFELGLSTDRLIRYALVHDVPEVYAFDTPNFLRPGPVQLEMFSKDEYEGAARVAIQQQWGDRFPELLKAMDEYEAGDDEESKLICALEKILAVINIYQDDGRTWQKLEIKLDEALDFQERRLSKHPLVSELWQELKKILVECPQLFHQK